MSAAKHVMLDRIVHALGQMGFGDKLLIPYTVGGVTKDIAVSMGVSVGARIYTIQAPSDMKVYQPSTDCFVCDTSRSTVARKLFDFQRDVTLMPERAEGRARDVAVALQAAAL